MEYFIVKYTGLFAFIKPWTAVRDELTFSQQFLTESMIAGIERKLFPELLQKEYGIYKIKAHRLAYEGYSEQQEVTQTRGWNTTAIKGSKQKLFERPKAILKRGVLLNPVLYLAFSSVEDAETAMEQHICLARNEDLMFPEQLISTTKESFEKDEEQFSGFELVFEKEQAFFHTGYNRFNNNMEMYGWLRVLGHPVKES